jgi:hypothetical protein
MAAQEIKTTSLYTDLNAFVYYQLSDTSDNSLVGLSGNRTLTNSGSVAFSAGKFGDCADFGNTDGNENTLKSSSTIYGRSACTISFWLNVNTAPATDTSRQIMATANDRYMTCWYQDTGGTKSLNCSFSGGSTISYGVTLTTGTWYHIAITLSGDVGTVEMYIDGSNVASGSASNFGGATELLTIGGGLACKIDDFYISSGALSATTIGYIAAGGLPDVDTTILAIYRGSATWTVPTGVTNVKLIAIGGGGNGATMTSNGSGGGGGGGARATTNSFGVTATNNHTVTFSGDTSMSLSGTYSVLAKAGASVGGNSATGGDGGDKTACTGDICYSGGRGADGSTAGGGGGGAALDSADGNAGSGSTGGAGGDTYAGSGGTGQTGNGNGGAGGVYGGGGGGARRTSGTRTGGSGAGGLLIIANVVASGPANLKSFNGLAKASVKSINGLAIASIKSVNSLA